MHPELASLLGVKEDSRVGVVQALWNYIKVQGLQDKVDRRMVRADAHLRQVYSRSMTVAPETILNSSLRYLEPTQ